jgi:uncharacterized RDD family membrane protein YckC
MDHRTYRALLIANSTFPRDSQRLTDLEGPRNDPALLREALCDRQYGLFLPDNVRLVQERTMSQVLLEVENFFHGADRQDLLLVYYTGHGRLNERGELFLCAHDTLSDRLLATAVKASDVRQIMNVSAAGTTVVLLDCCHAGAFKGGDLPPTLAGPGRFLITSCRRGELANDTHVLNRASLFTHHLVEGIRGGAPDHDQDGLVSLSELYHYVHKVLTDEGRPRPEMRFDGAGHVPIARRQPEPLRDEAPPQLDVSTTEIDLGEIGHHEALPPERIAVINRGGGSLDWTVQASADWIEPVVEGQVVELHFTPRPGPNRANLYVSDSRTGAITTVRVRVQVREPPPPPPFPPRDRDGRHAGPPVRRHLVAASWGHRIGAAVIDGLILLILLAPASLYQQLGPSELAPCTDDATEQCETPTAATNATSAAIGLPALAGWFGFMVARDGGSRGQTPGKGAMGSRVVDLTTGDPIGYLRAAGRIAVAVPMVMFCLGIPLIIDASSRRDPSQLLHDKVFGSVVVRTTSGTGRMPRPPAAS